MNFSKQSLFLVLCVLLLPGIISAHTDFEMMAELFNSSTFFIYLQLGFVHIIPRGFDHILFILSLFLLSPQLKPIVWQATVFTLAHSITLALALYNVVVFSPKIIEPIIALSIAYVAIENCMTEKLNPTRILVVFVFGLIHGMGFAGVLKDFGLENSEMIKSLLGFNIGVEIGQLSVIILAWLGFAKWFGHKSWYRKRCVIPVSLLIAAVALYWTIERVFF